MEELSQKKKQSQTEEEVKRWWVYEDGTPYSLNYSTFLTGEPNNYKGGEECLALAKPTWLSTPTWAMLDTLCSNMSDNSPAEHLCAMPLDPAANLRTGIVIYQIR